MVIDAVTNATWTRLVIPLAVALTASACATDVDGSQDDAVTACLAASDAIASCQGAAATGGDDLAAQVAELCETDPEAGQELLTELDGAECPSDVDQNDLSRSIFQTACASAHMAAHLLMRARNPDGRPLSQGARDLFRPYLGDVVDEARLVPEATLLYDVSVLGRKIALNESAGFISINGMTFGREVFLHETANHSAADILGHELVHVAQRGLYDSDYDMAYAYCGGLWDADVVYDQNRFEVEAIDKRNWIVGCFNARQAGGPVPEDCP